jgi:hypothetical protein
MELALTLISIASFFALVLAWTVLPSKSPGSAPDLTAVAATTPQVAH